MKQGLQTITAWLDGIVELLKALLVLGILVGVIWDDYFHTLEHLSVFLRSIGDEKAGLAGLLAIVLVVTWYKKK